MLIDNSQEKLYHAIAFFVRRTRHCYKVKLFKLLYFLDFQHYQETGRSVTNLEYFAWPKGPVPKELFEKIDHPDTLQDYFDISETNFGGLKMKPKFSFTSKIFSKREIRILTDLVSKHKDDLADDMVEATHLENLPWHRIYNIENRKQEKIPYNYALKASERDIMQTLADEHKEFKDNYDDSRNSSF